MSKIGAFLDALDMAKQARLKRAREMGFDVDRVMYHGTAGDFTEFDPAMRGTNTGAGGAERGFFFSDNKADADLYLEIGRQKAEAAYLDVPEGKIHEVYLKTENPLVLTPFDEANVSQDVVERLIDADADALDYALENGYDSVIWPHGNMGNSGYTSVVFDPSQIRSVNAAFDPAKKDSANLLASAAPVAVGLGAALAPSEEAEAGVIEQDAQSPAFMSALAGAATAAAGGVNWALEATEIPTRGLHGLASFMGELAAGKEFDEALAKGAQVSRQSLDETAKQLGEYVADETGSPYLAAFVDAITRVMSLEP